MAPLPFQPIESENPRKEATQAADEQNRAETRPRGHDEPPGAAGWSEGAPDRDHRDALTPFAGPGKRRSDPGRRTT
jgi:hypothetical protein